MNTYARNRTVQVSSVEIITHPSLVKNRINEDAYLLWESPGYLDSVVSAVIDGAGMRLPFPALTNKLHRLWPTLSAASFAANTVKKSVLKQIQKEPERDLREVLLTANDDLYKEIEKVIGKFDIYDELSKVGSAWANDSRNIRLILPACAVTLTRLDLVNGNMDFAHLGDTSLLEIRHNGKVIRHTTDQMGEFDQTAFKLILDYQKRESLPSFRDAVMTDEGRQFVIKSGIHLNYVDEHGKTKINEGCGVINGLPEARDYIETGTIPVDPSKTLGFVLMSDGLELLPPLQEDVLQQESRINLVGSIVQNMGIRELYNRMSIMAENDPLFDTYPRTKLKDDATGIFLQFKKISD